MGVRLGKTRAVHLVHPSHALSCRNDPGLNLLKVLRGVSWVLQEGKPEIRSDSAFLRSLDSEQYPTPDVGAQRFS